MSNTKHTPGPFIKHKGLFGWSVGIAGTIPGDIFTKILARNIDSEIDAELFASAPNILKEHDELKAMCIRLYAGLDILNLLSADKSPTIQQTLKEAKKLLEI